MKELTEEKSNQNNEVKFETFNISVGEINPKNVDKNILTKNKIKKLRLIFLIFLLVLSILLILFYNLRKKNNDTIKCEIGKEEKCYQCDKTNSKCIKCNPGYKLINGLCQVNYSLRAVYYTNENNQKIKLINTPIENILELYIDNINVQPSNYHNFSFLGNHIVYILFNTTTSLSYLFYKIDSLIDISFSKYFRDIDLIDISFMFSDCKSLISVNLNTKNVINMEYLFFNCPNLKTIEFNFNTENVIKMNRMFSGCASLTSINISTFNIQNTKDIEKFFFGCSSLTSLDLSNFKTNQIINMKDMFSFCSELKYINIPNLNTSNVQYVWYFFRLYIFNFYRYFKF